MLLTYFSFAKQFFQLTMAKKQEMGCYLLNGRSHGPSGTSRAVF